MVRNPALSVAVAASVLILIGAAVAVLVQLRHSRVNLASALIERARRAEDVSDWAHAAAYYAASRVQNDTAAARWGIALARERMPERGSALTGSLGAFTDVDVLPDGRLVALEVRDTTARLYEAPTGRTPLDGADRGVDSAGAQISSGAVRLHSGHLIRVLDEQSRAGALHLGLGARTTLQEWPSHPPRSHRRSRRSSGGGAEVPRIPVTIAEPMRHLRRRGTGWRSGTTRASCDSGTSPGSGAHVPVSAGCAGDRRSPPTVWRWCARARFSSSAGQRETSPSSFPGRSASGFATGMLGGAGWRSARTGTGWWWTARR